MTPSPRGETDPRIADFRSLRRRSRAVQARLDAGIVIPRAVEQQPVQLHWIVTLLATDDVAGLQVQRRSGGRMTCRRCRTTSSATSATA